MLQNKYTKLYFRIVENAKSKNRIKSTLTEKHHIVPVCIDPSIKNLNQNPHNGVIVTHREHFILHFLLCKMYKRDTNEWHKVIRAFNFMYAFNNNHGERYMNSRLYAHARKNIGYIMSKSQSGSGNSQYGKVWISNPTTEEQTKIDKHLLHEYTELGWVPGRIYNWDIWHNRFEIAKENNNRKIRKNIKLIDKKITDLNISKTYLKSQLQ